MDHHTPATEERQYLVVLGVGGQRVGVPLAHAQRLERTVAFLPLPGAPPAVAGVVDVAGEVVPVFDTHRRLGLPAHRQHPDDLLLLASTGRRRVALTAETVEGVQHCETRGLAHTGGDLPSAPHLQGVARLADGLVVVTDLERFLTVAEERDLDDALAARPSAS